MAFSPLTKREQGNGHNIIATCEKVNNGKRNRLFKETFFAALLDYKAPEGHEADKGKILEIVKKYRPDPEQGGVPEITEYFYPNYLQAKAGMYFTPKAYCELLGKLAQEYIKTEGRQERLKVYDPAVGVGALLLTFKKLEPEALLYGQELSPELAAIASEYLTDKKGGDGTQKDHIRKGGKPNFNGGEKGKQKEAKEETGIIKVGDTLKHDKFKRYFHIVLANPPFNQEIKDKEIIKDFGSNKGNICGVKQVCRRMKKDGIGLIILPGGILGTDNFKEGRKGLIKYNGLEGVFYGFNSQDLKGTAEGQHRFNNAEIDTLFLLLRKRKRSEQLISFVNCSRKTIDQIINEREKQEISREDIKKRNYNFLGFILGTFDDDNGVEIKKMYDGTLSRTSNHRIKKGYYVRVCHKIWKTYKDDLAEIKDEIIYEQEQEYLYLGSKDGTEETTNRLKNYLDDHREQHYQFFQSSLAIKHLMRKDFLNGKIDIKPEVYARPPVNNQKLTYNDNNQEAEKENCQD